MSDSHGETLRTRAALKILHERICQKIIHLGDIETFEVLDELAGNNVTLVFGNCDFVPKLLNYANSIEIDVQHPAGKFTIDGLTIGFLHGHDAGQYRKFTEDPNIHVLAHGHSHEIRDEVIGSTRFVNPGALHRAPLYTVAVLDTLTGELEFIEVEE